MHIERLQHLITILKAVPVSQFDLRYWIYSNECGTAACAVGWAAQDPHFMAQGLTLSKNTDTSERYPVAAGLSGLSAVSRFFDVRMAISCYLFLSTSYKQPGREVTPAHVIARLKSLIDGTLDTGPIYEAYEGLSDDTGSEL